MSGPPGPSSSLKVVEATEVEKFYYGLNKHRIIIEDILKATGRLGRQPHPFDLYKLRVFGLP